MLWGIKISRSEYSKCYKVLKGSVIPEFSIKNKWSRMAGSYCEASVWHVLDYVMFYGLYPSEHTKKVFVVEKLGAVLIERNHLVVESMSRASGQSSVFHQGSRGLSFPKRANLKTDRDFLLLALPSL